MDVSKIDMAYAPPGSGKTRWLLSILSHNYGFYFSSCAAPHDTVGTSSSIDLEPQFRKSKKQNGNKYASADVVEAYLDIEAVDSDRSIDPF